MFHPLHLHCSLQYSKFFLFYRPRLDSNSPSANEEETQKLNTCASIFPSLFPKLATMKNFLTRVVLQNTLFHLKFFDDVLHVAIYSYLYADNKIKAIKQPIEFYERKVSCCLLFIIVVCSLKKVY
jgi:hypothetical protein